jgi:uncharacterized protein (DUF427 family)
MTSITVTTPTGLRMETCPLRVRAMFAGHVVADSEAALKVYEPDRAMRWFFPRDDVETGYLGRVAGGGVYDPLVGHATCYTWVMEGRIVEQAVCEYERPALGAEPLARHLCLDDNVFEIYQLTERDLDAAPRATHMHGGAA